MEIPQLSIPELREDIWLLFDLPNDPMIKAIFDYVEWSDNVFIRNEFVYSGLQAEQGHFLYVFKAGQIVPQTA